MKIVATTPGKVVLLGEYAVREGAPAIVAAVQPRAEVVLEASEVFALDAPDVGVPHASFRLRDGRVEFASSDGTATAVVAAVIERMARAHAVAPAWIRIDTSAFSRGQKKLGLGASAAVAVALQGALFRRAGIDLSGEAFLMDARLAHNAAQGGRGSGIDVAASLLGGTVSFSLVNGVPSAGGCRLPDDLDIFVIWSGETAVTSDYLRKIDALAERAPKSHAALMHMLRRLCEEGQRACAHNDADAFVRVAHEYGRAMGALGEEAGADIMSRPHRRLSAIVEPFGAGYKPSGAGGGDIGLVFTKPGAAVGQLIGQIQSAGFSLEPLVVAEHGLLVRTLE